MRISSLCAVAIQASAALAQITIIRPTQTEGPPSDETASPTSILDPQETGGEPCGAISDAINRARSSTIAVRAELAYSCLQSVPIDQDAAETTIDGIINMLQFQSNLAFLANPPDDYFNEPVDLLAGMDDIRTRLGNGEYQNEYDFEAAISTC